MYALDLICSNGHKFEAWFANRSSFEAQRNRGFISCAICGDSNIQQVISPVRIRKHGADQPTEQTTPLQKTNRQKIPIPKKIYDFIERNFEDVGAKFADEAIKIHHGETERRNIRGTATASEEKNLTEEGVPFVRIPEFQ